jgi:hypothetical protein
VVAVPTPTSRASPTGTLKQGLFTLDNIHLTQDGGYELYASKLKPLVASLLVGP